jgi:hypothetical protein
LPLRLIFHPAGTRSRGASSSESFCAASICGRRARRNRSHFASRGEAYDKWFNQYAQWFDTCHKTGYPWPEVPADERVPSLGGVGSG